MQSNESPAPMEQKPPQAGGTWQVLSKHRRGLALIALLAAFIALLVALRSGGPGSGADGAALAAVTQAAEGQEAYYCPMHPHYKSEEPGNCPICSMKLVKLEGPVGTQATAAVGTETPGMLMTTDAAPASTPETIFIAPQRQQLIGVQSVPAEVKPLEKEIRTVGKVAYDETKVTHIHTKVTGYIEEVFVDFVGKPVTKGEPLFTIYSPDLVATQEEYLLALQSRDVLKDSAFPWIADGSMNLLEATRQRLRLWDITEEDIQTLEREGKVKRALTIYSPVSGIVTQRAAYHHGRYVTPDTELYTIVDLTSVWVLGEIYEYELPHVKTSQAVEIEFPYASNIAPLRGRLTYVYPYLNEKTRTAQIRMEFPNPDLSLRPDMFFNLKLRIDLGRQLVVPEDAVLDTGTQQYVFVDKGDGYFEPRLVQLGAEAGGSFAIRSGLKSGERVVTAANFILDSESRLKGAFANMGRPAAPAAREAAPASQRLSVEIREPREAKVGRNTLVLAIRDADGQPVEGADVSVRLFMPQMGSMPPMSSEATLQPIGRGEYRGTIDVQMAWTWETTVTVRKGGQLVGTVQTNLTAR